MYPTVSIIIVNWNTGTLLRDCIKSILDTYTLASSSTTEILVIDNASTDQSVTMVEADYPEICVIKSKINLGFGVANNLAAMRAYGDYLLFLNPDTVVKPEAIQHLVKYLMSHPNVGAVGPKLLNQDGSIQPSIFHKLTLGREVWRLFRFENIINYYGYPPRIMASTDPQVVEVLKGACILVRRDAFFNAGLFDKRFYMFVEEFDLFVRIHLAGWKIVWLPNAQVVHLSGQSTRLVEDDMFLLLYRSKVMYFRKYYGRECAEIYKLILVLASLIRYIPGLIVKTTGIKGAKAFWDLSRQYGLLIKNISNY